MVKALLIRSLAPMPGWVAAAFPGCYPATALAATPGCSHLRPAAGGVAAARRSGSRWVAAPRYSCYPHEGRRRAAERRPGSRGSNPREIWPKGVVEGGAERAVVRRGAAMAGSCYPCYLLRTIPR